MFHPARASSNRRAAAVVTLLAALAACGRCRRSPQPVVYDLAERLPVAERWSRREVLLFGTPSAEPHQAEGFYREAGTPAGDGFVWARGEAELSLTWPSVEPRAAVVELAPYRGVKAQSAEVLLNGSAVARLRLNDLRQRYRIPLPAAAQRAGDNRLRFVFAATASPADANRKDPDERQLAAAFYTLTVAAEADPSLDDLLARGAPAPFATARSAGVSTLLQAGTSAVRYAVRLPSSAELRFTPELQPAARAAAVGAALRVTVQDEDGPEREVWARTLSPSDGAAREVSLPLRGREGAIVRLGLHVAGAGSDRYAWASWRAPRVLGGAADTAPPAGDRGRGLRESLRGASVLLIVLDAARAAEIGCYGYARPTTPEIDRLASEGIVFERAYTPAVYTLGAMSSIWTSQYPDRHHGELSYADRLPRDRLTLADVLGAAGVPTAGFVANAMAGSALGFDRGFAEFHEVYRAYPEIGSRGESLARALPGWLARPHDRFFAYLHFREPHFPYDPPPPFDTRFGPDAPLTREQRRDKGWYTDVNQGRRRASADELAHLVRLYDGNLAYADAQIGAIRRALESSGLLEKTVVIVTADHGEQLGEHGYISHSAQVYEQSVHVPLIVRLPAGKGPRGLRVRGLVDHLDIAPTVLELLGVPAPSGGRFQGRSLLPVIAGAAGKPAVLSRTVWDRPVYALRDERFKLIYDTRTGGSELYDLEADPDERRELSAAQPLRAEYYRQTLQHWILGLRPATAAAAAAQRLETTPEQCENLKSLGYLDACR
jgi:arylsulfatase A-like enzyme